MTEDPPEITVYADYVCPFCYLGRVSFEQYEDRRDGVVELDWHPFDLRSHKRGPDGEIDHEVDDGKDETYFEQVQENVARLQDRYGAEEMLGLDELPDEVDSLDAQVASWYVKQEYPDRWRAFDAAVFEALWVDGRDIGDPDVLADLATDVGIAESALRNGIEDAAVRDAVQDRFDRAQRKGVTGVPTFVYGEHAARGAVPPAQLERLVDRS